MDKKRMILIAVGVLVAIIAISIARYCLVVVPGEQAALQEQEQVEQEKVAQQEGREEEEAIVRRASTLTNGVRATDMLSTALPALYQYEWESPEAGCWLNFSDGSVTIRTDGEEEREEAFTITNVLDVDVQTSTCALAHIGEDESLMLIRTVPTASVAPDRQIEALPVNPAAPEYTLSITFDVFSAKPFYPVVEIPFQVVISDPGKRLLGDNVKDAETAIRSFAHAAYPSATRASFANVATLDFGQGIYALFFDLDDVSSTRITVIYKEGDSRVQVSKGEITEYKEEGRG